jgi:hypothetical protein
MTLYRLDERTFEYSIQTWLAVSKVYRQLMMETAIDIARNLIRIVVKTPHTFGAPQSSSILFGEIRRQKKSPDGRALVF